MTFDVDVQVACDEDDLPDVVDMCTWARAVMEDFRDECEISIRIVDEAESAELNSSYRDVSGPTNVLSFPFEPLPGVEVALLGDVVICAPVVKREAREQSKPAEAHWAHMIVHGTLHLLGFDHERSEDADRMESLERGILHRLGYGDPYASRGNP